MLTTGATRTRQSNAARIRLPYPHSGQQAVLRGRRRFTWLVAGRRWRKTTLFMQVAVESAARGARIIWGAPVYDQVWVGWTEAKRAAATVADFQASRMTALFSGGGSIVYRSLDDPDNARSHTADGVVIDEAADVVSSAWREVLRQMLIDTGGWALIGGTPRGFNWLFQECQLAQTREDSVFFQAPTLGYRIDEVGDIHRAPHPLENPHISWSEIVQLWEATCPQQGDGTRDLTNAYIFHQEIGAEFGAVPGGRVYPTWSDGPPSGNVTEAAEYEPDAGAIFWGVDDGYVGRLDPNTGHYTADSHPRVFGLYQRRTNGRLCRFHEHYAVQQREDAHIDMVLSLPYPTPDYAAVDKSAAALKRWLHDRGIYTRNSPADVEESIKELRSGLAPDVNGFRRVLVHPRCKHLRYEMSQYRRDETTKKPIKEHDHGPDEMRYVYWTQRHE